MLEASFYIFQGQHKAWSVVEKQAIFQLGIDYRTWNYNLDYSKNVCFSLLTKCQREN